VIEAEVKELKTKIDEVHQAVIWLKERVAEMETRESGKIRTDHPHIVRVQGVCGGHAIIEGTRLSVKLIVGWVRLGMTSEEIVTQYPDLSIAQVADALAYYEDHPEEIEAEFAEEKRYLDVEIPALAGV
jgi:uncharacterized protein (DUF433 family)